MNSILGLHHVGVTVPNMEQAVAFFRDMFDAVTVMECGSVDVDDDFMARHLGVPKGVRIADQRVIQTGRGGSLELFEYAGVEGAQNLKHNGEVGAMHIAFEVDDCRAVAERLRARGVDLLDGPTLIEGGPMDGLVWIYLRAPWGQYLEIVSQDRPLGYEAAGGPALWTPSAGK